MNVSEIADSMPLSLLGGSFGSGEILLIFAVVLLLFGSKNLPSIARSLGKALEEFRRAARDVSNEIVRADQTPLPKPKIIPAETPKEPKDAGNEAVN
jgi:sec-independent protein translocase protein TatA